MRAGADWPRPCRQPPPAASRNPNRRKALGSRCHGIRWKEPRWHCLRHRPQEPRAMRCGSSDHHFVSRKQGPFVIYLGRPRKQSLSGCSCVVSASRRQAHRRLEADKKPLYGNPPIVRLLRHHVESAKAETKQIWPSCPLLSPPAHRQGTGTHREASGGPIPPSSVLPNRFT